MQFTSTDWAWIAGAGDDVFPDEGDGYNTHGEYFRAVCAGTAEVLRMSAEDTDETPEQIAQRVLDNTDQAGSYSREVAAAAHAVLADLATVATPAAA